MLVSVANFDGQVNQEFLQEIPKSHMQEKEPLFVWNVFFSLPDNLIPRHGLYKLFNYSPDHDQIHM